MIDFSNAVLGTKLLASNGYTSTVQGVREAKGKRGERTGINVIVIIRDGDGAELEIPPSYFRNFTVVEG